MSSNRRGITAVAGLILSTLLVSGCGGASSPDPAIANTARGPITVWMSSNEQELGWSEGLAEQWNQDHPDEQVTVQPIPAGATSEGVLRASITAGNAACLVYNIAPSAEPDFEKQGGLVPFDQMPGGVEYIEQRTGQASDQFTSEDGKYYQFPWKSNPVQLFYNKDAFAEAGLDPDDPALDSYQQLLDAGRTVTSAGATRYALWPSVGSEYYAPWSDFYPFFTAATGEQLMEDGQPKFDSPAGLAVAELYQTFYTEGLAPRESAPEGIDPFATGDAAMVVAGPWAIASYQDEVDWGAVPVPAPEEDQQPLSTYADAKNVGLMTACDHRATAWDFLKFSTSEEADGGLLQETGQMPLRRDLEQTYPDYFEEHPAYRDFAAAVPTALDSPYMQNSIQIWQTLRDGWTNSVIYQNQPIAEAFSDASERAADLANRK